MGDNTVVQAIMDMGLQAIMDMVLQAIMGQKIMDNMALQATTMVLLVEAIMDMVLQAIMRQEIMDNMVLQATIMDMVLQATIMDMVLQATTMDMVLQAITDKKIMGNTVKQAIMEMLMQIMDNMVMVSTEVIMVAVLRYQPLPEEFVEFVDSEPDNTKNNYKSI